MTSETDHTQAREEAAAWVVRLQGGEPTDADFRAFEAWLSASPAHTQAYDHAALLWSEIDEGRVGLAAALDAMPVRDGAEIVSLAAHRKPPTRRWVFAAAAAAAALMVVARITWPAGDPPAQSYVTARNETRVITLTDGSVIHMNNSTRLEAQISDHTRRITMLDGEASFQVAHDAARPFSVMVGDQEVRDVGTEFNIVRHDGRIALTVRSGAVDVRPATQTNGVPAARLHAGQALKRTEGSAGWAVAAASPDEAFAWTQGYLMYHDASMADVADDLSRYSGAPVKTAPDVMNVRFSGVLQIDAPDVMLRRLEALAPVHADRKGDSVTLRSKL